MPPIVLEELELLELVCRQLTEEPAESGPSEASILAELERIRASLIEGEELKDQGALMQQWDQQSALLRQLRESRNMPKVDPRSPYFAHLRLHEEDQVVDLCLGKATYIKRGVRIVDWRHAPISKIFYRYQQGDEYEEEIAGRLRSGTVGTRRSTAIRDAVLQRVDAPEGAYCRDAHAPDGWRYVAREAARLSGGEGAALRVHETPDSDRRLGSDDQGLHQRADKHLPDIASLIDPEQFELITRPSSGLVVIRGTAGSGKTTVALHRIAFLAYNDATIESERTLFVVFSTALCNYVSHVLPALGVRRVRVRTFRDWAAEQCRRLFPSLPRAEREQTPAPVLRLKLHPAMLIALEEQVRRVDAAPRVGQAIDDWASALCNRQLLEDAVRQAAPDAFTVDELERITRWNRDRYEELSRWMRGDSSARPDLDSEDYGLLLRAYQLRIGSLPLPNGRPMHYRHIAIDEVQDFSPLEVRVLLDCLDERRSMTLAGDTQQHVIQGSGFTSWSDFFRHLGIENTTVDTLRISYRSTKEIVDFAQSVLGNLREDDAPPLTTKSGPPVELFRFTDHGACVAFLGEALKELLWREPFASVVVLTPTRALSEIYFQGLNTAEVPNLHWVQQQDFSFSPGVDVTEVEQVKGLEFDYVILIEVNSTYYPDNPAARRLLHVGATRAIHQLWLTSISTPCSMVREAMARSGADDVAAGPPEQSTSAPAGR